MRMKSIYYSILLACSFVLQACVSTSSGKEEPESLTQYVEPRIGTAHCRWFHFTPGAMPFGMAKPGPSTNGHLGNASGWEATGYDYRENSIEGFPCLHEFQVGGIVLMPTTGKLITVPGLPTDSIKTGYRSHFDRANEVATAGYYSVLLDDYQIRAEVTATPRVAYQRFHFPKGADNHLLFDIDMSRSTSRERKFLYISRPYWINSHHRLVRSRERNNSREPENSKGLVPVFT